MSEHKANVSWSRGDREFTYEGYSRDHTWEFAGGIRVQASSAPDFLGNPALVDPEAAFVAAASSCHMLTFLAIAARRRLVVESYDDAATGFLEKNGSGKLAVTRVVLRPRVRFGGAQQPSAGDLARLHELAHENCFIANSVKSEIEVSPEEGTA
jgi:organic hydroperoxide reductase OsmC/OhrA